MTAPVIHVGTKGVALPVGRLIFGIDATASREATWAIARRLQAQMFREAAPIGNLSCQLVFYRGAECKATKWQSSGAQLAALMDKISCEAGTTQIGRVLRHTLREHAKAPVRALTFIGDACEEPVDTLGGLASEMSEADIPIFIFQEGRDPKVQGVFRMLALRTGGDYFEFNPDKIDVLANQLGAIAQSVVGDSEALEALTDQR